jgi:RND family efflux transporter MFP subunit
MYRTAIRNVIFLAIASILLMSGCGKTEPPKEYIRPVKAIKLGDHQALTRRTFPGKAEAVEEVNLGFDVPGIVIERPVNKGDQVKIGQLLARLDPRDFQNEIAASEAERNRALAYRNRIAEALKANAVAKQELTDAQARLDQAQATLKIKQKALEDGIIVAPFDGVIAATFVENFQRVAAKQEVVRLLDLSQIEITVDIPESLISLAPLVDSVEITFDAFPGRAIPGRIKEIGTEASHATRTYPVTVVMDQPDDIEILPGMAAKVSGKSPAKSDADATNFDIPVAAVFESEGQSYVWVIDEKTMTVQRREIEVETLNNRGIQVTQGLKTGEWIAIAGVHFLREGQKIRFMAADTREASS